MKARLVIAGGRDQRISDRGITMLDDLVEHYVVTEIMAGGNGGLRLRDGRWWSPKTNDEPFPPFDQIVPGSARGIDTCAEGYARWRKITFFRRCADWDRYGRGAGPKRNIEQAEWAIATEAQPIVALFPGRDGTRRMYEAALQAKKKRPDLLLYDWRDKDWGQPGQDCHKGK